MQDIDRQLPFRAPSDYHGPKRSLILAGGGMRLAYQAGVLKALEEQEIYFNHADGTSGGIFNLAMLFSGLTTDEMCDNWRTLKIKDFISYLPFKKYLNPINLPAFGDADSIINKVFPHLGVDIYKINEEKVMAGTFNVCNYSHKVNEAVTHDIVTLSHLIAGVSLPIFMPAVKIENDWYIDAVWIRDANLMEAVKRGAEEIWLIWAIGNIHEYKNGSFNQYVHMIEMSANGALFAEFEYIKELNGRIIKGDSPYGQEEPVKIHLIKPEYPLPLDTDLYFNKVNTTTLIDMGYADAKEYLLVKSQTPAPASAASTKMKSQGTAFSCRAKLRGRLLDKDTLLHLTLTIHDIYEFTHAGKPYKLAASLSFGSNRKTWYGYNGEFCLENGHDKAGREGRFQFQIQIEGRKYFLAGKGKLNKSLSSGDGEKIEVDLYEGDSMSGQLASSSAFSASSDWRYSRKSSSFYNTKSWLEKRKAKKVLKKYFFAGN